MEYYVEFDKEFNSPLSETIKNMNEYAKKLYYNAFIYTAFASARLGFKAFYSNDADSKVAYITQIVTHRECYNRKIGRTLLKLDIFTAEVKGMTMIKLEVLNNNYRTIRFYKRNGFSVCGEASADSMDMIRKL